jgi:phage FluMu protein Com
MLPYELKMNDGPHARRKSIPLAYQGHREEGRTVWPIEELRCLLPAHLRARLAARYVEVTCTRCGELMVFRRDKATVEEILAAARVHRCPAEGRGVKPGA